MESFTIEEMNTEYLVVKTDTHMKFEHLGGIVTVTLVGYACILRPNGLL